MLLLFSQAEQEFLGEKLTHIFTLSDWEFPWNLHLPH